MPTSVTFEALRRFLEGRGFHLELVPERRAAFRHATSPALVILRPYADADTVTPTDLVLVRRVLDDFGLMDGAEAERALHSLAHAG
jgi:hypothetical protein